MSFEPLLAAPWVIQVHAFAAIAAFFLGIIQFAAPKGTLPHRSLGAIWIGLMIAVTVSSIFLRPAVYPGPPIWRWFGPIHIFTVITAIGLFGGIRALVRGGPGLKRHKGPFLGMFIGGLLIAGAFAFAPGRIMHDVAFGG